MNQRRKRSKNLKIGVTRVLRVLGANTLVLGILEGIGVLGGLVHIADKKNRKHKVPVKTNPHQHHLNLSYLIYPIRGGAIIGVFMI
jgi:hypothetical protein